MKRVFLAMAVPALLAASITLSSAATYAIRRLSEAPGLDLITPTAVNDHRQVVGYSDPFVWNNGCHSFFWDTNGTRQDLGPQASGEPMAHDINSSGQVVGSTRVAAGAQRGFRWNPGGTYTELPPITSGGTSAAYAINDGGEVAGSSGSRAVVWTPSGVTRILPPLPGAASSNAHDINDSGCVVGYSYWAWPNEVYQCCIWDPQGNAAPLAPGSPPSSRDHAIAINNENVVIAFHASSFFQWSADTGLVDLTTLTGRQLEDVTDINDAGEIAGTSNHRAFVWSAEGGFSDLGVLAGCNYSSATGINNAGDVVGFSCTRVDYSNGYSISNYHPVIWETVPEPSSLIALGALVTPLLACRRRKA